MYKDWNAETVAERVRRELTVGPPDGATVEVGASPIKGSPTNYVYLFLSPETYDGDYFIISPDDLDDEDGIVIGRYVGEAVTRVEVVASIDAAFDWVRNELAS